MGRPLADACRGNVLRQSEVNTWIEQFLEGGRRNLNVNSNDQMVAHRKEIKSLQRKIGELVLENGIEKKPRVCWESARRLNIDSSHSIECRGKEGLPA